MGTILCHRQRALRYMRQSGVDVVIATSPVNVTYFTGYYCWLDGQFKEYMVRPGGSGAALSTFGVFNAAGESALVVDAALAVNAMDVEGLQLRVFGGGMLDRSAGSSFLPGRLGEVCAMLAEGALAASAVEALVELMKEWKLDAARVGLELDGLARETEDAIRAALPGAEFKDCSNMIRLVRMVKTAAEIARMERAAAIGEEAALASLAEARVGGSLREMGQRFRAEVGARGADLDHFAYGIKGVGLATESEYLLAADDALYIDYGCIYQYYCSDSGLTLAMSPLADGWLQRYEALQACLEAGSRAMRPGVRASAVPEAMWDVLRDCDIATSFPHGHGVGLEVRDYPILVADTGLRIRDDCIDEPADLPLENDMVLNLEAMVFVLGIASVHIEKSYVVGPAGGRSLTLQDRSQPFYPV